MGEMKIQGVSKMRIVKNLTFQVIVAIICGIAVGQFECWTTNEANW